jgi:hypothetical protein
MDSFRHGISYVTTDQSAVRATLSRQLETQGGFRDKEFAMSISVKRALREHGDVAAQVIRAELQQMIDKGVFHPVQLKSLSRDARHKIIRSSMFLKEKFLPSGIFEKYKARLVGGGDQQDKLLYDDLSAPTVSTSSVFAVAAIAASEGRKVMVLDIGGAYLNAPMNTGIIVHMRLDPVMTKILNELSSDYSHYTDENRCVVVALDKALYGCVESAALWYNHISRTLTDDGYVPNPHDPCVFNKVDSTGVQCTLALHVDDIFATSESLALLDALAKCLEDKYHEYRRQDGPVIGYLGMTFDFTIPGEARVTMDGYILDLIKSCEVIGAAKTPAAETLFDVRESGVPGNLLATPAEAKWFHLHHKFVAKVLYAAKRVLPECLTTVAFLATRVTKCDQDDMKKLVRLLRYIIASAGRGIVLRPGARGLQVRAWIDAAYGVHADGKSHTGSVITIGDAGPIHAKSGKQHNVTKSSTEAELVGLSDSANQGFHIRNFIIAQGHDIGPLVLYQDNLSCMA